ncbi:MAG TPA: formate/nitrite transporter family protein [Acidimicrobiales bacterium]|nr:formate/nitrite transporter family protein [Acidimicrobiales bacterium]
MTVDGAEVPPAQYLPAEAVLDELASHGAQRLRSLSALQVLVLGTIAGGFITAGALFSLLLASGTTNPGVERLLEGFGFSAGFFFVILSGAALFTEANVVLPATVVSDQPGTSARLVARFWALAWVGNLLGATLVGFAVHMAQHYPPETIDLLHDVVGRKLAYRGVGGSGAWFQIILSGVLANWLVGMAAFFATMGRTIIGKYIPILLAVSVFVAANFQHSPANMGYFSLAWFDQGGPGIGDAFWWSIIPAGIGNMIGGSILVVLPFTISRARKGGGSHQAT